MPNRWALETFPWERQPGAPKTQILELAGLSFLGTGTNIVFMGGTGVGKTGLATGILLKALLSGRRGQFVRAQDLFDEMYRLALFQWMDCILQEQPNSKKEI